MTRKDQALILGNFGMMWFVGAFIISALGGTTLEQNFFLLASIACLLFAATAMAIEIREEYGSLSARLREVYLS
jgi:hypothetical protein